MTNALPKIVGLTGGIGSGKSQVRRMFEELGIPSLDGDVVARTIHQDVDHPAVADIAAVYPHAIDVDGRLNRGSLRDILAKDAAANARIRAILQPHVVAAMTDWTAQQTTPYVVWESALIIEADIAVDRVLVVDTTEALQIQRIKARNPDWTDAQIKSILSLQLGRDERNRHAHDILRNEGTLAELQLQVEALHQKYLTLWG